MEQKFKYIIFLVLGLFLIGFMVVMSIPRKPLTLFEEVEILQNLPSLKEDLPRRIGTIGTMDSITYRNKTFIYSITVFGDNRIHDLYRDRYEDFGELLKYSFIKMNGQSNMATHMSTFMKSKELAIEIQVYSANHDCTKWRWTGSELKAFVDSCKVNPTEALKKTLDMQLQLANINLPTDEHNPQSNIHSISSNSLIGEYDSDCLLQSIRSVDDNIIITYKVNEDKYNIQYLDKYYQDLDAIESFAKECGSDPDSQELMGLIAITHSNLIIEYVGSMSKTTAEVIIPYLLLKKFCQIPNELLI